MNNEPTRRIGLMGGTFDPLHIGHLFIAENARLACGLEEVIFFPNGIPAHAEGKNATASAEIRLEMTRRATSDNPYFRVSDIEIKREGKSYAFDTIQEFQRQLGSDVELHYIVGADSMRDILTWYRGAELFDLCRFVASTRPGFNLEAARANLNAFQQSRVTWLEAPGLHIASRELRERIKNGHVIRYLVPDEVLYVIESRKLYSS
jgi:nicotinate-nucleotide adenylyltransferase